MISTSKISRADAAKRRRNPLVYQGVDLEQEAWRYCQALGYQRNVELRVTHSATRKTHGYQWCMVTTLTIGFGASLATVLEMLLHEVCHATHMEHSEEFISLMVHAARDVWGISIEGWQDVPQGREIYRAYAVDEFLEKKLAEKLCSGEYKPAMKAV